MRQTIGDDAGFRAYLHAIAKYPALDGPAELALARRWQRRHDLTAAHTLTTANLRFVVAIARRYGGYGFRLADLVEEGNIGLLEAVRRFEPARGLRFMTYASYWVRAYILAHVLKQWSLVSVGVGPMSSKLFFRLGRERARLAAALNLAGGDEQVDQLLAEKFGTTVERIRATSARLSARDRSLDGPAFADGDVTHLDLLVDDRTGQESDYAHAEQHARVRQAVRTVMAELSPRDRYIVEHRLMADETETLATIGAQLRLSRERVRQLEARLKKKLRRALKEVHAAEA